MQQEPTPTTQSPNLASLPLLQDSSLVTWPEGKPPSLPPLEQKNLSPEQTRVLTSPKPSTSSSSGGARRWEIQYGELKLEQKLGHGAFGEVFSGSYRKSKVAVKLYDFRGKLPNDQKEMLLQEANVMEGLRSEYLVAFRGICLDPRYCLVMEFCEGGTLRARLDKASEAITPLEQLRWAMQISYGVYQLHSAKIVHRDLKGENILLDRQGEAKVADFGLSIVKSSSANHSRTSARGGAGTIPWMAPELHDGQSNSQVTDVYSLGVTLWEIVSRKMPYVGLMMGQMISRTVQGKRDPLPNPCPEVFRLMITACCHMEAKQRPTAEQVGNQFAAAIKSGKSLSTPMSTEPPKFSSTVDSSHEEIKNFLEKEKQLELEKNQEKQQRVEMERKAIEEKRQLEAEKQANIERIKQQHEAELERARDDLKRQPQAQAPKSTTPPLPPVSQTIPQTLMAPPKPKVIPEQSALQDQFVEACKQGDEKAVETLFKQGAQPDITNTKGEHPLGAAVWGMCPEVVNALLNQMGNTTPMCFDECKEHNLKHYKEVFIVQKSPPQDYGEWYQLLLKIESNSFLQAFHLAIVDAQWRNLDSSSWESLKRYITGQSDSSGYWENLKRSLRGYRSVDEEFWKARSYGYGCLWRTEYAFNGYKKVIETGIKSARLTRAFKPFHEILKYKTPTRTPKSIPPFSIRPLPLRSQTVPQTLVPELKLKALDLQDQLIAACKQGNEETVKVLLQQGAKPNIANTKGEQPLGAAVWGMCPHVVNALLQHTSGVASMTWQKCEQHNLQYYGEVFIIAKFNPQTYGEWNELVQKMDPNLFIRTFHLNKSYQQYSGYSHGSWENLQNFLKKNHKSMDTTKNRRPLAETVGFGSVGNWTEKGFVSFKTQIKQFVETASRPTLALPSVSQSSQILMPTPKPAASLEQLKLQDQLIATCKQGDEKMATMLLKQGAKPDMANAKGEQPLGAAVWGMCPDVVNALLTHAGEVEVTPMTWDECEEHNLKYYKEVFIVPKFDPQTYGEWYQMLLKMDPNPFVRAVHLKKADELTRNYYNGAWISFTDAVRREEFLGGSGGREVRMRITFETEQGYVGIRTQIKKIVETAKQPTVRINF